MIARKNEILYDILVYAFGWKVFDVDFLINTSIKLEIPFIDIEKERHAMYADFKEDDKDINSYIYAMFFIQKEKIKSKIVEILSKEMIDFDKDKLEQTIEDITICCNYMDSSIDSKRWFNEPANELKYEYIEDWLIDQGIIKKETQ